jgi:tRNA pseudouridine55 synthase
MDGFFVVDKPAGMTSHDVVSAVRRIVGQKKVGHTGTLDPFATGVLPVALGEGTKAIPFLDESEKEYRAVMCLGETTDTQDCTGNTIRRGDWQSLTSTDVENAVMGFLGKGTQVPPMYSAIKKDGIPLYKLARKGEEIHREPRNMEIYSLVIEQIELPVVTFTVRCSRGVYVRTLANDMGELLGSGAHLTALRRNASGSFLLGNAVSLDTLFNAGTEGRLSDFLISCNDALFQMKSLYLNDAGAARVHCGIAPALNDFLRIPDTGLLPGERVKLNVDNQLVAVAENGADAWPDDGSNLHLLRVFNEH